jgi:hypothetical protein
LRKKDTDVLGVKPDCKLVDAELDRRFAGRAGRVSPAVQKHLDECDRCRTLYVGLSDELPAGAVPGEVEHRIVQTIQSSLKPVSRLRSTAVLAAQIMIVFLLVSAAVTSRMKVLGLDVMTFAELIAISTILSLGIGLLALSLAWQMRPGSLQRIPNWTSVGILVAALLVVIVSLFPWKTSDEFVTDGWRCLRTGLAVAVPTALVFWILVRRGAPLRLKSLGGTLGAIAGLLGVTVLQFTCELQNAGHLMVWHVGVLVLSTLAGALIGECLSRFGVEFR